LTENLPIPSGRCEKCSKSSDDKDRKEKQIIGN